MLIYPHHTVKSLHGGQYPKHDWSDNPLEAIPASLVKSKPRENPALLPKQLLSIALCNPFRLYDMRIRKEFNEEVMKIPYEVITVT